MLSYEEPGEQIRQILRLKSLVGGEAASSKFSGDHPLAAGLDAARKSLSGRLLSPQEQESIAILAARSATLFRYEGDWAPRRDLLTEKLLKAAECRGILFELDTERHILRRSTSERTWTSLIEGQPDWTTSGPDCVIECKLARSVKRVLNYQSYLADAAEQHPAPIRPLIVAIGFDGVLSSSVVARLHEDGKRHLPWMTRHQNVAGVLVFGRTGRIQPGRALLGVQGTLHDEQRIIEIRNHNSIPTLPMTFRFGTGPETFRTTLPGPMQSLTKRASLPTEVNKP